MFQQLYGITSEDATQAIINGHVLTVFVKQKIEYFRFLLLMEAAYLIRNESSPDWKVEKVSKENMIPKNILENNRTLEAILPYLPDSQDPQDSINPGLNLQILFYDTSIEELMHTFEAMGKYVSADLKADVTQC